MSVFVSAGEHHPELTFYFYQTLYLPTFPHKRFVSAAAHPLLSSHTRFLQVSLMFHLRQESEKDTSGQQYTDIKLSSNIYKKQVIKDLLTESRGPLPPNPLDGHSYLSE